VATDLEKRDLEGITVQADDIFSPRREIYEGASLLYSLRPPLEVQIAMGDLARRIGADVLFRPMGDEIAELPGFSRRLVNAGEARFYLFRSCFRPKGLFRTSDTITTRKDTARIASQLSMRRGNRIEERAAMKGR
jgi:uncharacterized UPF0146 family protein